MTLKHSSDRKLARLRSLCVLGHFLANMAPWCDLEKVVFYSRRPHPTPGLLLVQATTWTVEVRA